MRFGNVWSGMVDKAGMSGPGAFGLGWIWYGRLGKARSGTLRFVPVGQVRCVVASFGKDSWGKAR
jgi:hypothetical protein